MQEIRCPKCGEVFQVDESCYDQIAQQVRDKEFEKELERRKKELDDKREQELKVIRLQEEKEHTASLTQKDAEISAKDQKIAELQAKLDASETAKSLAVSEALEKKKAAEAAADDKERRLQKATLLLQAKYGKNAVLKGMNLSEDGTTRLRNEQVGGHKA